YQEGRTRCVARGSADAHLSRDGALVAFVRDGDLYVVDTDGAESGAEGSAERRLTHDAQPAVTNGVAEFIAQEEMHRGRGFWLSRDGTLLAFTQIDERHIPIFRIPHPAQGPYDGEEHRYPFAGGENARIRLGVVPTAGGDVRWLSIGVDVGEAEYLA